jgi:hypothetical protein
VEEALKKKSGMVENTKKVTHMHAHVYVFMDVQIFGQCVVWQGMSQGSLPSII